MRKRNWEELNIKMYEYAEDYLNRFQFRDVPINIIDLCHIAGITMLPYSTQKAKDVAEIINARELMELTDGFTLQIKGIPVIFWDDSKPITRQRFTIAHEIGHYVLGHTGECGYPYKMPNCHECLYYSDCIEWQADSFAFNLLAPNPDHFTYRKENAHDQTNTYPNHR